MRLEDVESAVQTLYLAGAMLSFLLTWTDGTLYRFCFRILVGSPGSKSLVIAVLYEVCCDVWKSGQYIFRVKGCVRDMV